jgi:hypothetical protein
LEGVKNPANGPSRWPDYEQGYKKPIGRLLANLTVRAITPEVEPYDDLLLAIQKALSSDTLAIDVNVKIVDSPMSNTPEDENQWTVVTGALTYIRRIYVPADEMLRTRVISLFHDSPESGHFGLLKTTELVSRDFYWPAMDTHISMYVSGCKVCHRVKAPRHARHSTMIPLAPPTRPWEGVTIDFVTDSLESTASEYMGILVIVDRLTNMVIYLPCRKDVDSPELARLFFEHVICKHGVPDNIITD